MGGGGEQGPEAVHLPRLGPVRPAGRKSAQVPAGWARDMPQQLTAGLEDIRFLIARFVLCISFCFVNVASC